AACPRPPYTTSASSFSATSGSRLFISIRIAASACQVLHVRCPPRGARTVRPLRPPTECASLASADADRPGVAEEERGGDDASLRAVAVAMGPSRAVGVSFVAR